MPVDWGVYWPYIPITDGPFEDLPRRDARRAYAHLMAAKAERVEQLRRLVESSGIRLGTTDADLQALNDWFRGTVELSTTDPNRLSNLSYAVVHDVALFLGDVAIERSPGLRWEMFTRGKRDISFQQPVIMGFTKVANPRYHVNLRSALAVNGLRVASGMSVRDDLLVAILHETAEMA